MRLPYLRKAGHEVLATARAQRWDPVEVLRVLLAEEVTGPDAATRRMRRKAAGFAGGKTFATWRPEESSIAAATQNALTMLEWIGRAENLVVAGPSGTAKSHFAEALAHTAIDIDLRVAHIEVSRFGHDTVVSRCESASTPKILPEDRTRLAGVIRPGADMLVARPNYFG